MQVKCNFLRANKLNANPPKATFYCKLECFLHLRTCLKTPQKSANQNLELSPPPTPPQQNLPGSNSKRYSSLSVITISNFQPPPTPPSKTYRGETQSDIHRFPSSAWPPPPPPSLSVILPSATALSVIFFRLTGDVLCGQKMERGEVWGR